MKIAQVVIGGGIPIPPNQWGACERILYFYWKNLIEQGHECELLYLDETRDKNFDIIHIHSADLCKIQAERNQSFVFTSHDHHLFLNDYVYNENDEAIGKSLHTFFPGKNLLEKYSHHKNISYLEHGVDTSYFIFKPRNLSEPKKILCCANNGVTGNSSYDRKGFRIAIEAAKALDLEITVCGPKNNEHFFNANQDLLSYSKLNIKYDLTDDQLLEEYYSHHIFLNPSEIENGHPNLTLLEALATGLIVVATYQGDKIEGLISKERNLNDFIEGIKYAIDNYENLQSSIENTIYKYDWSNVVKKLILQYQNIIYNDSLNMKSKLLKVYNQTEKRTENLNKALTEKPNRIFISYLDGTKIEISGHQEKDYNISFFDNSNGNLVYSTKLAIADNSYAWAAPNQKYYTDWKILVNDQEYELDLKGKNILITIETIALGDNIAFLPAVSEFRKKHECNVTVSTFHNYLFEKVYPELTFIPPGTTLDKYQIFYRIGCFDNNKDRNKNNWQTITLQKVSSDILGLEYKEIRTKIHKEIYERPIPEKYFCISEWSTMQMKLWNLKGGWQIIVDYLNSLQYKVMVISKESTNLNNIINKTNQPMNQTINNLYHSEGLICVGSGIAWLNWALGKKTVMISGFSSPFSEFQEDNYRVFNEKSCNSCYNDPEIEFNRGKWDNCPRNKDFECSKRITPMMVIKKINELIKDLKNENG